MIEFADEVRFDLTGNLRVVWRPDGHYVIGKGMLLPVSSREEGEKIIKEMKERRIQDGNLRGNTD